MEFERQKESECVCVCFEGERAEELGGIALISQCSAGREMIFKDGRYPGGYLNSYTV